MLDFTGSLRVFLEVEPVDVRKSFSGLFALVMNRLKENPLQGALFVFSNRGRSRLKMLYWDGTGLWVLVKRLEKATFAWPVLAEAGAVKLLRAKLDALVRRIFEKKRATQRGPVATFTAGANSTGIGRGKSIRPRGT